MSQDLSTALTAILTDEFGVPADEVTSDATFEALGLDSLDLVEVTMIVDEQIGVKLEDAELEGIVTVQDAVDAITAKLAVSA